MDNTITALQNLYVALGGDAADVANINIIPEMIDAISNLNIGGGGGGGSEPFVIDVSWDNTSNRYVTTKTSEEIATAITSDLYNIVIEIRFKHDPGTPFLIKDIYANVHDGSPVVVGSMTRISASNAYTIDSFKIGIHGYQGFGVYYEGQVFSIKSDGTTTVTYQQIPEVI
jgi:hypothetical protein